MKNIKPVRARKTVERLKWLEDNYNKFSSNVEVIEAVSNNFDLCNAHARRIIKVFLGEKDNTSDWRKRVSRAQKERDKCYFCGKKSKMSHHVSYVPERKITLCRSCHGKLHSVVESSHSAQREVLIWSNKLREVFVKAPWNSSENS